MLDFWKKHDTFLDFNEQNKYGFSPLMLVCSRAYKGVEDVNSMLPQVKAKRLEIIQLLLSFEDQKVDINFQHPTNQLTSLHWASYNDDKDVVQLLLDQGAV